jgi:hypothetical protein
VLEEGEGQRRRLQVPHCDDAIEVLAEMPHVLDLKRRALGDRRVHRVQRQSFGKEVTDRHILDYSKLQGNYCLRGHLHFMECFHPPVRLQMAVLHGVHCASFIGTESWPTGRLVRDVTRASLSRLQAAALSGAYMRGPPSLSVHADALVWRNVRTSSSQKCPRRWAAAWGDGEAQGGSARPCRDEFRLRRVRLEGSQACAASKRLGGTGLACGSQKRRKERVDATPDGSRQR